MEHNLAVFMRKGGSTELVALAVYRVRPLESADGTNEGFGDIPTKVRMSGASHWPHVGRLILDHFADAVGARFSRNRIVCAKKPSH